MSRLMVTVLAVLVVANVASPVELGLALGSRSPLSVGITPYDNYLFLGSSPQAYGFDIMAEIPFSNIWRVGLRAGQSVASADRIAFEGTATEDASWNASGLEARVGVLVLIPAIEDDRHSLALSYGLDMGYSGCKTTYQYADTEYVSRSSSSGLVLTFSAGTRISLSRAVTAGIEAGITPVSVLYGKTTDNYYGITESRQYILTQLGRCAPTLNLVVLLSL